MAPHLDDLLGLSRRALCSALSSGEAGAPLLAVDATAGNGHDTLFLARLVGARGRVWAFDVQQAALAAARERVLHAGGDALAERVTFVRQGHENLARVLPESARGGIRGALFNLGFLPGSDKRVTTSAATSVRALADLAECMAPGGVVSVHCYAGHAGGREETDAVTAFCSALPWPRWRAGRYEMANRTRNREVLFLLEKAAGSAGMRQKRMDSGNCCGFGQETI